MYIKVFGYIGAFSFIINNLFSVGSSKVFVFHGLIKSFGSSFITNDSYIGLCFDLLVKLIFSYSIYEMSDFLRMFGIR